jgi:hypothetical protein
MRKRRIGMSANIGTTMRRQESSASAETGRGTISAITPITPDPPLIEIN